jgi:uncharacterized protein (TIGR04168 family)
MKFPGKVAYPKRVGNFFHGMSDGTDFLSNLDQPQTASTQPDSGDRPLRIAVIGDVHLNWDAEDEPTLKQLGVDLVLLVGDFGNEAVEVVEAIADLALPKAVILGNHDAWYSATDWGRKKCPYNRQQEDWVQRQLDALGVAHVGYGRLDFPAWHLSVVGARPFSWGGSSWHHTADFYKTRYGVESLEASTRKIAETAHQSPFETVVFIGHCGPQGLGDRPEDLCGRDWHPPGGDYGDPDFREAIAQTRSAGKNVPLVAFGHMHHHLRTSKTQLRNRLAVDEQGTVYLNAAGVPRIIETHHGRHRNLSLVTLVAGKVTQASFLWVDSDYQIVSEDILYRSVNDVVVPLPS